MKATSSYAKEIRILTRAQFHLHIMTDRCTFYLAFSIVYFEGIPGESRKAYITRLAGYRIKNMWPIFKINMLIYQSKACLIEKILFCEVAQLTMIVCTPNGKPDKRNLGQNGFYIMRKSWLAMDLQDPTIRKCR